MKRFVLLVAALLLLSACREQQAAPAYIVQVSLGGWNSPDYTAESIIDRIDSVNRLIPPQDLKVNLFKSQNKNTKYDSYDCYLINYKSNGPKPRRSSSACNIIKVKERNINKKNNKKDKNKKNKTSKKIKQNKKENNFDNEDQKENNDSNKRRNMQKRN